jgi:hypothetical protein
MVVCMCITHVNITGAYGSVSLLAVQLSASDSVYRYIVYCQYTYVAVNLHSCSHSMPIIVTQPAADTIALVRDI